MGFKVPTKRLVFTDPDLADLEVYITGLKIGQMRRIAALADSEGDIPDDEHLEPLFAALSSAIHSWNLEDMEGSAIHPTPAALADLPYGMVMQVMNAMMATIEVPPPLPQPPSGGLASLAASLPMEVLSASQPS